MNISRCVCLLLLSAAVISGCQNAQDRQTSYYEKALKHFEDNNIDKARVDLKNVLQINPKHEEARLLLADINRMNGDYRQAFVLYNAVLEENKKSIKANLELARIYFSGQQDEKALEYVDEVLAQNPKHKDANLIVAGIESRRRNTLQATSLAQSVLNDFPKDPDASAVLASIQVESDAKAALITLDNALSQHPDNLMLLRGKLAVLEALQDAATYESLLIRVIEKHPNIFDLQKTLARFYLQSQKLDLAEKALTSTVNNFPDSLEAKMNLVEFTQRQHGVEAAEMKLKGFTESMPTQIDLHKSLAQFYVQHNKVTEAKNVFMTFIDRAPNQSTRLNARYYLAQILLAEKKVDDAQQQLKEIFLVEPNNAGALTLRAQIALSKGATTDAIADLRSALKSDPTSVDALVLMASAQASEGQYALALENYYSILETHPNDSAAMIGAAHMNLKLKDEKRSRIILEQLVKIEPLNVAAITQLTRLYAQNSQWQKADLIIRPLFAQPNTQLMGLILQGDLERGQSQWEKARNTYQEALKIAPKALEAIAGYTDSFMAMKDYAGAEKFLLAHAQQYPELPFVPEMLGKVYVALNQPQKAIAEYEALLKKFPDRITALQKIIGLYILTGQADLAIATLETSIKSTDNHDLKFILAGLYQQKGRYNDCVPLYDAILTHQPNNAVARNNYAVLLSNHLSTPDHLNKALEIMAPLTNSTTAAFMDTLGWIHFKLDHLPQAKSYLQAAVKQQPENREFRYHLGMIYFKSGDRPNAHKELGLAIEDHKMVYEGRDEAERVFAQLKQEAL